MRELEDFFPHIQLFAPACPEPTANKFVREAAMEFCRRTRAWRETDTFPLAGHEIETMCVPPHSELFEIEAAWIDGEQLTPARYSNVAMLAHESGKPKYISQTSPNSIRLFPPGPGDLTISMFLVPAQEAEFLPDFLFDQYAQVISWGALREICLLPNQPFTNPDMATMFAGRFEVACNRNFAMNIKGQQRARARTRPNFF